MTDMTMTKSISKSKLSVKVQAMAAIAAIIAAVALPQLFHAVGIVSGAGTVPGETFLPMHLPVILVGLLAGPYAGIVAGLMGPVVSFAMTGMPGVAMLPFMVIELGMYGLAAGAMCNVKIPVIAKLLITQIAGRAVKAAAIAFAVYIIGSDSIGLPVIWTSIITGIPGLILQWTMLPLIVFGLKTGVIQQMKDKCLEYAKEKLLKDNLTCVLYNGDETYISSKRGVAPLLEWVKEKKSFEGFAAADKVIGKAAAFLYVILNIKEVYAFVISKRAAMVFEKYGIKYSCESIVDEIINRAGTGFCPMEQTTKDIDEPKEALAAIKKKYSELTANNGK